MSGDESLGYWSRETRHFPSQRRNDYEISDEKIIEVYLGDRRCEYRSLETSHSSSWNQNFYHSSGVIDVDLGHKRSANISLEIVELIILVLMAGVELVHKRLSTIPLAIFEL